MATLSITRNYADGEVLLEADLDEICDDVEAFLNNEQLGDANIADASITASDKLIDSSVSTAKLAASAVTTAKINDLAVTTAKINDLGVTTGKINDLAVTTAKIDASAVTTAKIADSNVTTAKIADSNVTTAKIADSNVTTAKVADNAVTSAKRTSSEYATLAASNIVVSTSAVCPSTITGTSKPVMIHLMPLIGGSGTTMDVAGTLRIYKAGSYFADLHSNTGGAIQMPYLTVLDTTGCSGSTQYDIRSDGGSTTFSGGSFRLLVYEL